MIIRLISCCKFILSVCIICAFEICRKTPGLKTDANRFISRTVSLYDENSRIQKAQIMTAVRI
ncbi:MAG: hypothetical protein BWK80_46470 [Desulfobacteraceae bacterium IS3]|nr:MAG: hypothetical protein BWK80_46470 [Desulfobacteraceae bacterium IS3]